MTDPAPRMSVSLPAPTSSTVDLHHGDAVAVLTKLARSHLDSVDLIIADPPYFIDRATWDRRRSHAEVVAFHEAWLAACLPLLGPDGAIWVSGTFRSIHALGHLLQSMGMRIINEVTREKPHPRFASQRCLVQSTETLLWATWQGNRYCFNYDCMRQANEGKQLRSHWRIPPPCGSETRYGQHPGQKPLSLIERLVLATSRPGDLILDPFLGSGTTAVAAVRHGRRIIGIEREAESLIIARHRIRDELNGRTP